MNATELQVLARIQLSRIALKLLELAEERRETWRSHRALVEDLKADRLLRTFPDGYAGEKEAKKWADYKAEFATDSEVAFRNRHCLDILKALPAKKIVNFGCLYGWLEAQLHAAGKEVYGVDRSLETKRLNDDEFPGPNFVASDIFDFLAKERFAGAAFIHINVGLYFLPKFLKKLYRAVSDAGFQYVLIWEPSGVSRITGRYYQYSEEPQNSVLFRGPIVLHNYPFLLKEAGFKTKECKILRPPHPHRDYRSAYFLAERTPAATAVAPSK